MLIRKIVHRIDGLNAETEQLFCLRCGGNAFEVFCYGYTVEVRCIKCDDVTDIAMEA